MGRTPLHTIGDVRAAQQLIERGADPRAQGQRQVTPLHTTPSPEVARLLIDKGVPVEALADGRTPVHVQVTASDDAAVQSRRVAVVKVLLDAGANPQARTVPGKETLLHLAASFGRVEIMKLLIAGCADVNAADRASSRPLHQAVLKDRVEAAALLLERGARVDARLSAFASVQSVSMGRGGGVSGRDAGGSTPLALARSEPMKALLRKHGARD